MLTYLFLKYLHRITYILPVPKVEVNKIDVNHILILGFL